ncbi:bifunctional hydroxymethylpyrimidine kinase/phosphomethylpyrimidine kinase [Kineosporiaceae bacterium SCSIO 59966]|nr:bifunctional hydroxymethylpyrimidine kinase/phosphomethylpyrimidine kinase [Kineosporiaceae bacterium SCSIO 59966]
MTGTGTPLVALTVAGTDSGGAAGVAADLTTFAALGAHGTCAVTAVTAQDTTGVHRVVQLSADDVQAQVDAVLGDLPVAAVKTGMLGTAQVARVVTGLPAHLPLVVDPVLVATSGAELGDEAVVAAYRDYVLARATVVTPNDDEARRLVGAGPDEAGEDVALALHVLGPAVVLTGGDPGAATCRDVVVDDRGHVRVLEHPTVPTTGDHGTGCTFSAALAVHLGRGRPLVDAAAAAQSFVAAALRRSAGWHLGRGHGPVAHTCPRDPHPRNPQES